MPAWVSDARQPLLYATLGTYFNDAKKLALLVAALSDFDGSVLLTTGVDLDSDALPQPPTHVHIAHYVPQSLVMRHAAGVVCHGGANSILGAFAYGLPVVCIPQGADQFDNAQRCAEAGAGIQIPPGQVSPELIASAANEILTIGSYRCNARRIQQEILALPAPAAVARHILGPGTGPLEA